MAAQELFAVVWNIMKVVLGLICYQYVRITCRSLTLIWLIFSHCSLAAENSVRYKH